MVSKKSSSRSVPNVSAAASTKQVNTSSVLRSAFSPSKLQLSLFASVIQALDTQQLRIHDTVSGRLKCEHTPQRTHITCLDWGYFGSSNRNASQQPSQKKRRKLNGNVNGSHADHGDIVVAFGTNHSEIRLFSPAEAKGVSTLKGAHAHGIKDFKFKDYGVSFEAWSLDGDGKLVEWNLRDGTSSRIITISAISASVLLPLSSSLLVASQAAYLLDPTAPENAISFPGCANTIHSIVAEWSENDQQDPASFVVASESDRYMNVYNVSSKKLIGSLITDNDVQALSVFQEESPQGHDDSSRNEVLAAITKNGELEIFDAPFESWPRATPQNINDLKANKMQRSRKATASIKVKKPSKPLSHLPIIGASFQGHDLVLALSEGSVNISFKRIQWRKGDGGGLDLVGPIVLEKIHSAGIDSATMNGAKDIGQAYVDESRTVVAHGGDAEGDRMAIDEPEVIDISSAEEVEQDSEVDEAMDLSAQSATVNGVNPEDVKVHDLPEQSNSDENNDDEGSTEEEPSFGDLIRANALDTVDVAASFPDSSHQTMVVAGDGAPSGMSLGIVLSQSLRTNDVNLLESCFHVQDLHIVRATIERLDSTLAVTLLQKLAERLHSRPGRAGTLMVWIQWTLVAHGGYLAGQPAVVEKLRSLHRVVKERANSLPSLLSLKGKLDMLEAQMNLRRNEQRRYGTFDTEQDENDGVIYVEGHEDSSSSEESEHLPTKNGISGLKRQGHRISTTKSSRNHDSESEDSEEMDDVEDELDVSDEDEDSDREGFLDDEASETENDSDEEFGDEVNHDSNDEVDESEDEGLSNLTREKGKVNSVSRKTG